MKKYLLVLAVLLGFSGSLSATATELYFVEPMICKGQWNKQPPGWNSGYERAGIKILSFWSVNKKCKLVPAASGDSNYAPAGKEIVFDDSLELGSWFGHPLHKSGEMVVSPFGVWGNEVKLKVTSSKVEGGVRTDTLQGREYVMKDYYYDLSCTAKVVKKASRIHDDTKTCGKGN